MPAEAQSAELTGLTISAAGEALRAGEISPVELTAAYLERIERLDPRLGAYVAVAADRAVEEARRAEGELRAGTDRGPLHGIPIAIKDVMDTAGTTTAAGSAIYADRVPTRDATVAARLREAGTVLLGKTSTPEFAMGVVTTSRQFGPTRNPWDLERSPGGSSGGSGAAVAALLAAGAVGTDNGGSIRIPASFCGVVGLKPTFGLVPRTGLLATSSADNVGPLARTVEDAAILLQAMAGYDAADPATLPTPLPDYRRELDPDLRGVRVGIPRSTAWARLEGDVAKACEAALGTLRDAGAEVVDVSLPDPSRAIGIGTPDNVGLFPLILEEARWAHREGWARSPDAFGPVAASRFEAPGMSGAAYAETLEVTQAYAVAVREALVDLNLLASPTVPITAPPADAHTVTVDGVNAPLGATAVSNTMPYNVARLPAASVPCGLTSGGLPVGLQLAAAPLGESRVLRAARAVEMATGISGRHPPSV